MRWHLLVFLRFALWYAELQKHKLLAYISTLGNIISMQITRGLIYTLSSPSSRSIIFTLNCLILLSYFISYSSFFSLSLKKERWKTEYSFRWVRGWKYYLVPLWEQFLEMQFLTKFLILLLPSLLGVTACICHKLKSAFSHHSNWITYW